jgi:hypothetical protein
VAKDRRDQISALRKVAVDRANANASFLRDLAHWGLNSHFGEHCSRRLNHRLDVALSVSPYPLFGWISGFWRLPLQVLFVRHDSFP